MPVRPMPSSPRIPNLRRLMAQHGLAVNQVAERTGLDQRTIKGVLEGTKKPHPQTIHKLAKGLGVSADELFLEPSLLVQRCLDRATNPAVDEVVSEQPDLVDAWTEADFDELYSRAGTGGGLTPHGALDAIRSMNRKREVPTKVEVLLESGQAELVEGIVGLLYRKVVQDGKSRVHT
ncbi:MAG: helix-turn-helix transcriptional regulator [Planctomycetota bacterium]